jgi:NAD(P)-dependent dehydrogenase (short-subunit alcohol dehydrogenase family)
VDLGLDGKTCIVTGASRGIGLAVAEALDAEGARVVRVSRSAGIDVTAADAPDRVLEACGNDAPWALVNNAGVSQARGMDVGDDVWQEQWELHVMAPMRLMRALCPLMAEAGGGRVVNVSSSSGKRPSGRLDASYSVTKAALLSLSRVFADAWAGRGVLVNAVAPGPVDGELWTSSGGLADQVAARQGLDREAVLSATRSGPPVGRMGSEEEVAAVIAFLCSTASSNVAGAAWSVDGGSVPVIL